MNGFLPLVHSEISVNMLCIYALAFMYGNSQTVASIRDNPWQKQEDWLYVNYTVI